MLSMILSLVFEPDVHARKRNSNRNGTWWNAYVKDPDPVAIASHVPTAGIIYVFIEVKRHDSHMWVPYLLKII